MIKCFLQPIQLSNTFVVTFDPLRITMLMGVWEGDDTCYYFFLLRDILRRLQVSYEGEEGPAFCLRKMLCAR